MVLLESEFDRGFIVLLRIMVDNFLEEYSSFEVQSGLPLTAFYDQKEFSSIFDYRMRVVQPMDVEAQDIVVQVLPIVLRINIKFVLIDKAAAGGRGILEDVKSAIVNQKKFEIAYDKLNLHSKQLCILFKPGHYDLIYPSDKYHKALESASRDLRVIELYSSQSAHPKYNSSDTERGESQQEEGKHFVSYDRLLSASSDGQPDAMIQLNCGHEENKRQLKQRLNNNFGIQHGHTNTAQRFFIINHEEKYKSRPQCLECKSNISFDVLKQFHPMTRNSFRKQERIWKGATDLGQIFITNVERGSIQSSELKRDSLTEVHSAALDLIFAENSKKGKKRNASVFTGTSPREEDIGPHNTSRSMDNEKSFPSAYHTQALLKEKKKKKKQRKEERISKSSSSKSQKYKKDNQFKADCKCSRACKIASGVVVMVVLVVAAIVLILLHFEFGIF